MLQINSGKLYQRGVGRRNNLRGVLYTNLNMMAHDEPIVTLAGSLLPADSRHSPNTVVYELVEQMESPEVAPGVLISHTVEPYLHDFSAVVAFALGVTCSPDAELSSRLLSGRRSLAVFTPPSKLLQRTFDKDVWCQKDDAGRLISFVEKLIGLERKSFLGAMRAVRTFVTGLHRVVDDLELAYTLLVASIESLAQDFDGHKGTWSDVEESKRQAIDRALKGAEALVAERVRDALVESEHLAMARRFRVFALDHIPPRYFREDAVGRVGVMGRSDLRDALKEAYRLRSRYVHNLLTLPHALTADANFSESTRSEHATFLTFQGLARLAREIILEFVRRRPKVATEVYDYLLERHGIVRAQLSPEYWIGRPEGLAEDSGRLWLEGFLQQFAGHIQTGSPLTDLTAVIARIEELLLKMNIRQRRPFIALYCIYNRIVPLQNRSESWEEIVRQYNEELALPSSESLVTHHIMGMVPHWTLEQHKDVHDSYFRQRNNRNGLRVPAIFEAGMSIELAERYRSSGDVESARSALTLTTENFPHLMVLKELEREFCPEKPIEVARLLPVDSDAKKAGPQVKGG
jgi:hypothetical protein